MFKAKITGLDTMLLSMIREVNAQVVSATSAQKKRQRESANNLRARTPVTRTAQDMLQKGVN